MKILKFGATWCVPCIVLHRLLKAVDLKNIVIEDIDVDFEPERAKEYNIRALPTMVLVDDDGKEVKRLVGMTSPTNVEKWLHGANQ